MNRRKPERVGLPGSVTALGAGLALLVVSSCVACSGGGTATPTSSSKSSSATTSANTTSSSNPSKTLPPSLTPTTTAKPVARCPVLKATATLQEPLECTSATVIGAAAARAGLKRYTDTPTLFPSVLLLSYSRTVLLPLTYRREVNIFHYANGAVTSLLCSGVVAKTLDPVLAACLDVGPSTRTDRAAVRAWALRAEVTIAKSAKAQPFLTSGKLSFVACSDPSFPKNADKSFAFEINLYVEHSGSRPAPTDCPR